MLELVKSPFSIDNKRKEFKRYIDINDHENQKQFMKRIYDDIEEIV